MRRAIGGLRVRKSKLLVKNCGNRDAAAISETGVKLPWRPFAFPSFKEGEMSLARCTSETPKFSENPSDDDKLDDYILAAQRWTQSRRRVRFVSLSLLLVLTRIIRDVNIGSAELSASDGRRASST